MQVVCIQFFCGYDLKIKVGKNTSALPTSMSMIHF